MSIQNKKYKINSIYLIFFIMCMCLLEGIPDREVRAAEKVNFSDFREGSEDIPAGVVSPQIGYEPDTDSLSFGFDTYGYQEKYYTATAFKNLHVNVSEYSGVSFRIKNSGSMPVRMNFALTDTEHGTMDVASDCYVKLTPENNGKGFERYSKVEYGCFAIPAGFVGRVDISFRVLRPQDDTLTEKYTGRLQEISGYGIICVANKDESCSLTFSDIRFLHKDEAIDTSVSCELIIEGEEQAYHPRIGTSNTFYHVIAYDMLGQRRPAHARFYLSKPYDYVSLSEDGRLVIEAKFQESTIELMCQDDNGLTVRRSVALYDSWTNYAKTEDGIDASLASPSEIMPVSGYWHVLKQRKTLWIIRGILLAGGVLFWAGYMYNRIKNRRTK